MTKNQLEEMIRNILKEGPNSDAQIRLVAAMKRTCEAFLSGKTAGLIFIKQMETNLSDFKKTTGSK